MPGATKRDIDDAVTVKSFVAGQTIMERNPMSQPISMVGNSNIFLEPKNAQDRINEIVGEIQMRDYDINNPDTQYLRYQQMMKS